MDCENCGKVQPAVLVGVWRQRGNGSGPAGHGQNWCLDCIQGKNPKGILTTPE